MTQRDRDRLVVLKKAQKKLITQRQAAEELQLSERQVRRLLVRLKEIGDQAVVHGLRGRRSNRKLGEATREKALRILSEEVYRGFGPTLASEYLAKKHKLRIGREALRQLMMQAGYGVDGDARPNRCICGGRGAVPAASRCSGTSASTTGWIGFPIQNGRNVWDRSAALRGKILSTKAAPGSLGGDQVARNQTEVRSINENHGNHDDKIFRRGQPSLCEHQRTC